MRKHNSTKRENPLLNLLINIVIPVFILTKYSSPDKLGPVLGLIVALAFPILYGIYDIIFRKKYNIFSIIGVLSVALTGSIGLLQLPPQAVAIKEAAVPLVLGIIVLATTNTKYPLVKKLIYNKDFLNIKLIEKKLKPKTALEPYIKKTSYLVALSFLVSSILNFVLAKLIVKSQPGTVEFNVELARMTALSFPVIAIPAMIVMGIALYIFFKSITKLTGLPLEEIIKT